MMKKDVDIFQKYFPATTAHYCWSLWEKYQFNFKITRSRQSKLGDYSFRRDSGHKITVNGDLNPYAFLVTYIHEVAHLATFKQFGSKPNPHGKEWKKYFKELFMPLLNENVLPSQLLIPLAEYLQNPSATTQSNSSLVNALRTFDPQNEDNRIVLATLEAGEVFELNGRYFEKGELRRTRFLCTDKTNGKRYVVSAIAMVKKV
jgi:SprT protein